MSVPVDLADLAAAIADAGPGYLLSAADGRVKAVGVAPVAEPDGLVSVPAPGRGSLANVATNSQVTLLFAPPEPGGMTLLVDGVAEVVGDDLRMRASGAIWHRPRSHETGT